jgi:hypothetical protein
MFDLIFELSNEQIIFSIYLFLFKKIILLKEFKYFLFKKVPKSYCPRCFFFKKIDFTIQKGLATQFAPLPFIHM